MRRLKFIMQYILNPRTVGAVFPSSHNLAEKMIDNIDFSKAQYIVEYGPGTGVFTDKLLKYRNKNTIILIIEHNYEFYNLLKEKYKKEINLYIINDSAEYVDKYLKKYNIPYVDYVVSGLPFASLPKNVSSNILNKTRNILKEEGNFITFQYTLLKKEFINKYFELISIQKEFINIPPAYILCCSKNNNINFYDKRSELNYEW